MRFISEGVKNGIWSGRLVADAAPARLCAVRGSDILAVAEITADGVDGWRVSVALPGSVVSDGAQTLTLIADAGAAGDPVLPDAVTLARLDLIAGTPLQGDLSAEILLLREEIELLKREFRRFAFDR